MKLLQLLILLSCGLVNAPWNQVLASGVPRQDHSAEIDELVKQLAPGVIGKRADGVYVIGPTLEAKENVRTRLLIIAKESPESRRSVIHAMIAVVNEPIQALDFRITQWVMAVELLGELKATEAVGDLVRNLNRTGAMTTVRHPPVRTALVRIGQPAIPSLLGALSDLNESLRNEASEALGEIGEPAVEGLVKVLTDGSPWARTGAAHALSRAGGARARAAIEHALLSELNEEVRNKLEYAVEYMNHVDCLNNRSKCK